MKQVLLLFLVCFLISCTSKKSEKDIYLENNLEKILSLDENDIVKFKESMSFDEDNNLSEWNDSLLNKAYKSEEDYTYINFFLYRKLGVDDDRIIFVNSDNTERVIELSFTDINKQKKTFTEIANKNALFYIVSTNCGYCVSKFNEMNELATKLKNYNLKFIAFFENAENIKNYKKGEVFKLNGFLSDDWNIFQKNKNIELLTSKYDDSLGFPFIFFRKEGRDLELYPEPSDISELEKIILENYNKK